MIAKNDAIRLFIVAVVTLALVVPTVIWKCSHDKKRERISCRSRLVLIMQDFVDMLDDERILPQGTDLADACLMINESLTEAESKRKSDMNFAVAGESLFCPSAHKRDGSIGYVYVGEGLRLGEVKENDVLIVFCSVCSHGGWSPVWHARDGSTETYETAEMVGILQKAIERGESGEVHYSPRAMGILREELAARILQGQT